MTKKKVDYKDPGIIDDREVAKPLYEEGPNKTPLPERKLSPAEIKRMVEQMFKTEEDKDD